jgi:hypothetical protein
VTEIVLQAVAVLAGLVGAAVVGVYLFGGRK